MMTVMMSWYIGGFPKVVVIMFMTWINYSSIDTLYRFYLLRNIKLLFVNAHRVDSNSFFIIVPRRRILPLWINLEDDSRRYVNGSELSNCILNGRYTRSKPFGFYQTTLVVVSWQNLETNKLTSLTQLCFSSKKDPHKWQSTIDKSLRTTLDPQFCKVYYRPRHRATRLPFPDGRSRRRKTKLLLCRSGHQIMTKQFSIAVGLLFFLILPTNIIGLWW